MSEKRISYMESILDNATELMDNIENAIKKFEDYQTEVDKLEKYYESQAWKDDLAMDEEGAISPGLKRGVLSEDGVYNFLERNKMMFQRYVGDLRGC